MTQNFAQTLDVTPRNVIENENGEFRAATGPVAVEAFRFRVLISGLRLEMRCPGMKVSRGVSCVALAKRATGLKTNNREKLIARLEEMQNEKLSQCLVVTDGDAND